jgi:hypothetical protein
MSRGYGFLEFQLTVRVKNSPGVYWVSKNEDFFCILKKIYTALSIKMHLKTLFNPFLYLLFSKNLSKIFIIYQN